MDKRLHPGLAVLLLIFLLSACTTTGDAIDLELTDEPLTGKFIWHDLITDDVEAAKKFYGELFGWTFRSTTRHDIGDYTLILSNGHYLGGIVELDDPAGTEYSRWLGYLSVENVDRASDLAVTEGGRILVAPRNLPYGRAAAITDPEGAVLGIARTRDGDPVDRERVGAGEIVWDELLSVDPVAMAEFYRELGGPEVTAKPVESGTYHYLIAQGRNRAGILQRPNENVNPVWVTHFSVPDAAVAARKAAEMGGKVLLDASPDIRNGAMALVSDPTGALLALQGAIEQEAP